MLAVTYEIPMATNKTCMICDGTGKVPMIYGVKANTECEFVAELLNCVGCKGKGFRTKEDKII